MLKFKVDENLPTEAASLLISPGHDVSTVLDEKLGGRSDSTIASVCQNERRDLDFADIRRYPPADYAGIIVLRLSRVDKYKVLSALERLIPVLNQEPLVGKLWIVDEMRVRIRGWI